MKTLKPLQQYLTHHQSSLSNNYYCSERYVAQNSRYKCKWALSMDPIKHEQDLESRKQVTVRKYYNENEMTDLVLMQWFQKVGEEQGSILCTLDQGAWVLMQQTMKNYERRAGVKVYHQRFICKSHRGLTSVGISHNCP